MINVSELSKAYGKQKVLDRLSIQLHSNQVVAVLGPNGSGKSTLFKCLLGLVYPDSGQIQVMGEDPRNGAAYRRFVGYMPQVFAGPEHLTVERLINLIMSLSGKRHWDTAWSDQLGIMNMVKKPTNQLSVGMRQKVSAFLALGSDCPVYILDEPTASLDPHSASIMRSRIRRVADQGSLVLVSSHSLPELDGLATHVLYMNEGKMMLQAAVSDLIERLGQCSLAELLTLELAASRQNNVIK